MHLTFWLRWTWRDLRQHLVQVLAIAGIIALGSGIYAGLGSTSAWRTLSLDTTFSRLRAHDVEVSLVPGTTLGSRQLHRAVEAAGGRSLTGSEARLVVYLPVRAGPRGSVPAAGVIVGVDVRTGPRIDRWKVMSGRSIGSSDANGSSVVLDEHFAQQHHLPPEGTLTIAGIPVTYVGTVLEPEYLNITTTLGATIQGAATRAVIFAPIGLVQRLAALSGQADDVVATVRPGTDVPQLARSMTRRLTTLLPFTALTVTARGDDPRTLALYDEVDTEQKIFDVFALLLLAGAGFATFNLTRRMVESQRRDIGISMSLGVPPLEIAIRPVVFAAEVAVIGALLGILAGWAIGVWVITIIQTRTPLPFWTTPWQGNLFLLGAALGLAIPLAGCSYPVWRAVRVPPTDALLPPHLRGTRHRLTGLFRGMPFPRSTMAQAPLRRITIAPVRSLMTVLAIALILAPLLAALGTTDSATATIDAGTEILAGRGGDRLLVDLSSYQPATSSTVASVVGSPLVGQHELGLDTGGYLVGRGTTIGVSISMVDLSSPLVVPAAVASARVPPNAIVISSKAASDLGLQPGSRVILRHPIAQGTGYRFADTALPVGAVVTTPYRFLAYMDLRDERVMGLSGIVNTATLVPRPGVSMDRLQRSISSLPGVASALPASSLSSTMRDILSAVTNFFIVLQLIIGLLAFLVAYNSSKIASDERSREHATMMAFGVRVRQVIGIGVAESLILGIVATGVGFGLGVLFLHWILDTVFPAAVPELSVLQSVRIWSFAVTALIGITATAAAPVFLAPRLRRSNLPNALRYVE